MKIPSLSEMLQAGVHFGHQSSRWHPKMKPFIFTQRNGVHIIDLQETQKSLEHVLVTVKELAASGKKIAFITTKPQARELVKKAAIDCGMPYLVERWIGGLLTNFVEIRKLIKKYISLKEKQASGELERYTKKEQLNIAKMLVKMDENIGGLTGLDKMPDALFIPSVQREKTAITEANTMGVPVVGICDSNANPHKVTYVIPANDDAVNALTMIVGLVAEAVKEGRLEWEKKGGDAQLSVKKEYPAAQSAPNGSEVKKQRSPSTGAPKSKRPERKRVVSEQ